MNNACDTPICIVFLLFWLLFSIPVARLVLVVSRRKWAGYMYMLGKVICLLSGYYVSKDPTDDVSK